MIPLSSVPDNDDEAQIGVFFGSIRNSRGRYVGTKRIHPPNILFSVFRFSTLRYSALPSDRFSAGDVYSRVVAQPALDMTCARPRTITFR